MTTTTRPITVVLCTAPDATVGGKLARAAVEERLAACVSVLPAVQSVYRWQGKVEEASEVLLVAKTAHDRVPALVARFKELHPYEVPEIIALPVEQGLPAYLAWVVAETERVVVS